MANNLPMILAFQAGTNPSESWRHWKEEFEDYLEALRYSEAPEKTKIAAQPYWHCKEELYSTKEGIICRGQRLVVPVKYRKEILKLLHVSHKGIVSSKIKAREYFY
ncbi:hypothetical protein TNIN_288361 [Trichonephila inaurata madagascariensis]|uniref:Uncharacterized protein n=1 Tax=Trichonephila inaurata madagascariensis TaxID=2747483 RepID=A0A8X6XX73_9ARAC|nr:hypothetical protein TNIN_288361 [Trichonephila inaurata madagascariensis]